MAASGKSCRRNAQQRGQNVDRQIARWLAHHHGVATWEQLRGLGLNRRALEHRIASGRLVRVHQGVYTVGGATLSPHGHRLAAVLACGAEALLSHRSAAGLWDLRNAALHPAHVLVPGPAVRHRPGIRVHRTTTLHPDDVARRHGVPVTSVARTLIDLAGALRHRQVLHTVEQADRLRLLDVDALRAAIERNRHRRGVRTLIAILADYAGPPDTDSGLERAFLDYVRHRDLPEPQLNVTVDGMRVDAFWPRWNLVVELDSRGFHLSPRAFEEDRRRDARHQIAGRGTLRITHKRLTCEPNALLRDILGMAKVAAAPG